ncbi:hypothetical protein, partial [Nitrosovibrio sp. Nv17]|uniref:hypothetical protein n=1 Tax=Nitrosovibrio sp. Nv17 TaxID=1855339 RepID=UPI001C457D59
PVGYESDLNLYAYVGNNPINRTDPSGNCPWCIAAVVGALAGGGIDLGAQLISNGGNLSQVDWDSVGISTVAGAGLSLLGPTGGLLGRGGARAIEHGYAKTAGLLNHGAMRFGWTINKAQDAVVPSLRVGKKHFDIPGISLTPKGNPVRDGLSAGILGSGLTSPSPSQGSMGNTSAGAKPRK